MKEIKLSVPTGAKSALSKALKGNAFRESRTPQGELASNVSVLKLGAGTWYEYQNLILAMNDFPDNVYMKTGDIYQELSTGKCVKLKTARNKFLKKTQLGFQNFDIKSLGDEDRLVLSATQGCLNGVFEDHHVKLPNPKAEFKDVITAAYSVLSTFPLHGHADFPVADNTAAAVSCLARGVTGKNIGFKASYWLSEGKKMGVASSSLTDESIVKLVMGSKTLDNSFKDELLGYEKKKYLAFDEINNLCQIVESTLMNSGLKLSHNYNNSLVGVTGEKSSRMVGKCVGYTTERKTNGAPEYVVWVKSEDNCCLKIKSGSPFPKKMLINAFAGDLDLEFAGVVSSQTPAITYSHLSPLLREKLGRPAVTEMIVSPSDIGLKVMIADSLIDKERIDVRLRA